MKKKQKKQIKADLEATKRLLEEYGWIQNAAGNCQDGFCISGALEYHIFVEEHDYNDERHDRAIYYMFPERGLWDAVRFNDDPDHTKEDVLNKIDEAIASL